jgi:hypothetical protein
LLVGLASKLTLCILVSFFIAWFVSSFFVVCPLLMKWIFE